MSKWGWEEFPVDALPEPHDGMSASEKGALLLCYIQNGLRIGGKVNHDFRKTRFEFKVKNIDHNLRLPFNGSNLAGAQLQNAHLENSDLRQVNLNGADLRLAFLERTDLSHSSLERVDFTFASMSFANLRFANLNSSILRGTDLRSVDFSYASLDGVYMPEVFLERVLMVKASLDKADLSFSNMSGVVLAGASLNQTNMSGASLSGADFNDASLNFANLKMATVEFSNFTDARLHGACLVEVSLDSSNFTGAQLNNADLTKANIDRANFSDADLSGASLLGVNGTPLYRRGAHISAKTFRRSHWNIVDLVEWRRAGAILIDFENLPPNIQAALMRDTDGLTLRFNTALSAVDRMLVDSVIAAHIEATPQSDCDVVEFRKIHNSAYIRIMGSNPDHLTEIAEALYQRVWEKRSAKDGKPDQKQIQLIKALGGLANERTLRQLSWLVSRIDQIELIDPSNLNVRNKTWTGSRTPESALIELLGSLFTENQLAEILRENPMELNLLLELPRGGNYRDWLRAVVDALNRHRLIDEHFFSLLCIKRPRRKSEIDFAASLYNVRIADYTI